MKGDRVKKVNKLINRELSKILLKVDFARNPLVTLTRVRCSNDLKNARVFVSVMPEKEEKEVFKILNEHIYEIQQKLNKRLRDMKNIPKIRFVEEEKVRKAAEIERVLENLDENEK